MRLTVRDNVSRVEMNINDELIVLIPGYADYNTVLEVYDMDNDNFYACMPIPDYQLPGWEGITFGVSTPSFVGYVTYVRDQIEFTSHGNIEHFDYKEYFEDMAYM